MPDLPTANDFNSSAIGGRNDSKSTDCLKPGEMVTNTCEEFLDRVLGFKFRTVAITSQPWEPFCRQASKTSVARLRAMEVLF